MGHILYVIVHAANEHDTKRGPDVIAGGLKRYSSIEAFLADLGYRGTTEDYVKELLKKGFEIATNLVEGWIVIAKRWVVERTFAWLNLSRRLAKDFEISTSSSEAFIKISHFSTLLRRLVKS
jgi:transposase